MEKKSHCTVCSGLICFSHVLESSSFEQSAQDSQGPDLANNSPNNHQMSSDLLPRWLDSASLVLPFAVRELEIVGNQTSVPTTRAHWFVQRPPRFWHLASGWRPPAFVLVSPSPSAGFIPNPLQEFAQPVRPWVANPIKSLACGPRRVCSSI